MNETTQPGPLEVRLSDQLGPEERAKLDALLDHIYEYGTTAEGVLLRAAQLCQAAKAKERERCAKLCDEEHKRDDLTGDYRYGAGICAMRIRGA